MEAKKMEEEESKMEREKEWVELELPLGDATETFELEKVVCSHGFFMMTPNIWNPLSKSLLRPLRLRLDDSDENDVGDASLSSVMVRISQPHDRPQCLLVRVHVKDRSLSARQKQALLTQVSRMLRLWGSDERIAREFRVLWESQSICSFALGRVFRSPTLFEDMVKCILLCNCQWPRTLSMVQALCDLQLELRQRQSLYLAKTAGFVPKTPPGKDFNLAENEKKADSNRSLDPSPLPLNGPSEKLYGEINSHLLPDSLNNRERESHACDSDKIGNFPSPEELAGLEEGFLAKSCNLGYRAGRILKLARGIVDGRIQLKQFEKTCKEASLSGYNNLSDQLKQIDGFGPFTCANVLICMGFYHVIPSDSETLRHLQQIHSKRSTIQTVHSDVQAIYAKYAPFQFLAYWSELWHFYETRFGKLSEMPCSDYKLITASNMRSKTRNKRKRNRTSSYKLITAHNV